jgi:hypothetical protein
MKTLATTAIGAGLLISATWTAVGIASAAPTGPSSVDDTVRTLEADGYNVIVNRTGAAPLSQCVVDAVRPGQTHLTTDSGDDLDKKVTSRTVYLDVSC